MSTPAEYGPHKSNNGQKYTDLLKTYDKVYNFAGHAHVTSNYAFESPSPYAGLESHVVARSGGQLWVNDYIANYGTPCGYLVCRINDKDIKWRFRTISIRKAESVRAALPKYSYRLWTWKGGVGYIGEKRVDHYLKHSTRYKELNGARLQGVTHLFRVKPDESTGKGTVSVTDRFGDTFTYEVAL